MNQCNLFSFLLFKFGSMRLILFIFDWCIYLVSFFLRRFSCDLFLFKCRAPGDLNLILLAHAGPTIFILLSRALEFIWWNDLFFKFLRFFMLVFLVLLLHLRWPLRGFYLKKWGRPAKRYLGWFEKARKDLARRNDLIMFIIKMSIK